MRVVPKSRTLVETSMDAMLLITRLEEASGAKEALGFDTESSGEKLLNKNMINMFGSRLTGCSLAFEQGDTFYIPIAHTVGTNVPKAAWRELHKYLMNEYEGHIWAHSWKHELHATYSVDLPKTARDSLLLMWLLESPDTKGRYGLKHLVKHHFGHQMATFEDVSKGRPWEDLHPLEGAEYATEDAWFSLQLGTKFSPELCKRALKKVFLDQEMPLIPVLARMESAGMAIDDVGLSELAEDMKARLAELQGTWEGWFPGVSITSPKQVAKALYPVYWNPSVAKVNKDGPSVDKAAMEKQLTLYSKDSIAHKAASLRLEYQAINKNYTTYTHKLVDTAWQYDDERLHPTILQHGTVTGRVSMSYPNLMQIPARSDLGKEVKKKFVPGPGKAFVCGDYSQIELRVLAHYAGPGALRDAFASGVDIHQQTADLVGCTRDQAKTVNFAYIYGAGPRRMAEALEVPVAEAHYFMDKYALAYLEVPRLRDKVIARTKGKGFIRTMSGRLRHVPELRSPSFGVRSYGERIAFNTLIQGGASDIVKLAMLDLYASGYTAVCQVHDEIVLECPAEDAHATALELKDCMQRSVRLRVPLVASVGHSDKSWYEAKV